MTRLPSLYLLFFFNDTATTEIYTLSLHDALPISQRRRVDGGDPLRQPQGHRLSLSCLHAAQLVDEPAEQHRSEEHTSELQSRSDLVCRLLLEKKKKKA